MKDERDRLAHPPQPVGHDADGVRRFKANALVRYLLDAGPFDMNDLSMLPGIPKEDYVQFAQLIGYSVHGFADLSYVDDEDFYRTEQPVELVSVPALRPGDRILLDDGEEAVVKHVSLGPTSNRCRVHLKGRPPLGVVGYWHRFIRRVKESSNA